MNPQRYRPPIRRMILELVAALCVYIAATLLINNVRVALVLMVATMFLLRLTRPKPS